MGVVFLHHQSNFALILQFNLLQFFTANSSNYTNSVLLQKIGLFFVDPSFSFPRCSMGLACLPTFG